MGLFRALSDAIYKEYDRRIKRASLVKEYGVAQHHAEEHLDEVHAVHDDTAEDEAEIVNIPPGTPVAAPSAPAETAEPND
ncbi:MAG TPA: hypothetical protein VGJ87_03905 [Roseiflexaceae bacterium]|jgi:hypothetical protein